jgi:predicted O-linked N-acetylglucosamine transferase (SPINDLY family)
MISSHSGLGYVADQGVSPQSAVTSAAKLLRRELAACWLGMPPADVARHYAERLGNMQRTVQASGLRDGLPSDDDRDFISRLKTALSEDSPRQVNPGKLLAAMPFLFPHEMPHRYELEAVPPWLLRDYLAFTLTGPAMFRTIGEAEAYYAYSARWTGYLHDKVLANSYNEFWRNIGWFFTQNASFIQVYFNTHNLRDLYKKRAAILERIFHVRHGQVDHAFGPRAPRNRLRLGILAAHYAPQTETYATLPIYRYLDRTKFEVLLFALKQTNHPLEQFCVRHADRFIELRGDLRQRLQVLRAADLDLVLVGTNTTLVTNDTTMLALHRIARIQVASVCSCTTTGMRNMDYYLSGRLSEPPDAQAHYTEKLVMLDGPAHCFDFGDEPPKPPVETLNRESLGIAGDATVFVSGANFYKILPEVEDTWMRILSAIPGSRLVLYPFNPNWSSVYPAEAFRERLDAAMARYGLDRGRVIVLRAAPARPDVLQRLRLADIYLDSFPYCGATSLLDPLEARLPIVIMDGGPARTLQGAAFLRDLKMDELIVKNADEYVALAARLAGDAGLRDRIRGRLETAMRAIPSFLDSKSYGARVGLMFEQMWQESGYGG